MPKLHIVIAVVAATAFAADVAAAPMPVGPSEQTIQLANVKMEIFTYHPSNCRDPSLLLVFHGVARNAPGIATTCERLLTQLACLWWPRCSIRSVFRVGDIIVPARDPHATGISAGRPLPAALSDRHRQRPGCCCPAPAPFGAPTSPETTMPVAGGVLAAMAVSWTDSGHWVVRMAPRLDVAINQAMAACAEKYGECSMAKAQVSADSMVVS
jgi:hypothetical protein